LTQLDISDNKLAQGEPIGGNFDCITGYEAETAGVLFLMGLSPLSGVVALANAIKDMGALTSLHVGQNRIPEKEMREIIAIAMRMDSMKILCEIPFKDKTITELDVSGKKLGTEGALVVAEYLDGNEALSSVNLLKNKIGIDQAKALASLLQEHPTLKSLCGNKGDETGLDMSSKMNGAEDAIMLVAEIIENGGMASLNLASNILGVEGAKIIAAILPKCT
jgi:Ran GTPase-activating protein (RanGAP) involved in mRNA processing and transport